MRVAGVDPLLHHGVDMLVADGQTTTFACAAQPQLDQLHHADDLFWVDGDRGAALDGLDHLQVEAAVVAGQVDDALFARFMLGSRGQQARARVTTELRIQRGETALELLLLHIQPQFAIAAQAAMDGEARPGFGDLGAGMEYDPADTVLQDGMEEVIGLGAGSLLSQIQPQSFRLTEELQGLIQQVGAQIVPETTPRYRLLAPAIPNLGAETVEVGFQMIDLTQFTTLQ